MVHCRLCNKQYIGETKRRLKDRIAYFNKDGGETISELSVLSRLGYAFNFPQFCLKPLQVKCFEYLLNAKDIVAVLPKDFGKSLLLMSEHISNLQRLFNTQISIRFTRQASRELTPHNVLFR